MYHRFVKNYLLNAWHHEQNLQLQYLHQKLSCIKVENNKSLTAFHKVCSFLIKKVEWFNWCNQQILDNKLFLGTLVWKSQNLKCTSYSLQKQFKKVLLYCKLLDNYKDLSDNLPLMVVFINIIIQLLSTPIKIL